MTLNNQAENELSVSCYLMSIVIQNVNVLRAL